MCGIAGAIIEPRIRPEQDWLTIRRMYTTMLVLTTARGTDAAGTAVAGFNGLMAFGKMPGSAAKFIQDEHYQKVIQAINPQAAVVIGHTRAATSGPASKNENNHPFQCGSVVGVHNGWIHNDDDLTKRRHLPIKSQCDSEVIFWLLNKESWDAEGVTRALEPLEGAYAVAATRIGNLDRILLAAGDMPLAAIWDEQLGVLWYDSTAAIIQQTYNLVVGYSAPPARVFQHGEGEFVSAYDPRPQAWTRFEAPPPNYSYGWWKGWRGSTFDNYFDQKYGSEKSTVVEGDTYQFGSKMYVADDDGHLQEITVTKSKHDRKRERKERVKALLNTR